MLLCCSLQAKLQHAEAAAAQAGTAADLRMQLQQALEAQRCLEQRLVGATAAEARARAEAEASMARCTAAEAALQQSNGAAAALSDRLARAVGASDEQVSNCVDMSSSVGLLYWFRSTVAHVMLAVSIAS